jgi:hypothetical protein
MTTLHGLAHAPGRAAAADVGLLAPARQEV